MLRAAGFAFALTLVAAEARADVFKYVKADGSVVYTDKLSDLPTEKRAYYNQKIAEREQARANLEQQIGKQELERRELEAERQARDDKERADRLAEIDARLKIYRDREKAAQAQKQMWQKRMRDAKQKLEQLLLDFQNTQESYNQLATRADFTLLPGQGAEREKMKAHLAQLEQQIDAQILLVEEQIPDEAR